ncbi:MAG: EamA family transporter [Bacteriovoracaceae bacterium]
MNSIEVYTMAVGANLAFSTASMVFSHFARKFNSMWMNQVKVAIALLAFSIALVTTSHWIEISWTSATLLLLSGFAGLCIGDIFLFRAFAALGAGRTLVLYSFQPLLLGVYGFFFLGQFFTINQTLAVVCMMICIFIFMFERNKLTGSWDLRNFFWAFLGICLDAFGVMLTRSSYELTPNLETFQVNVIRCIGAIIGFILINPKSYIGVTKDVIALPNRDKTMLIGSCIAGTFLSLTLYLAALKYAHVGTLTAISITGPVWVAILESIYHRRLPSRLLLMAFAFFLTGFYLMAIA